MQRLLRQCPKAIASALKIAESREFNLADDLGYELPDAEIPAGYTPASYLRQLCEEAAIRRYSAITPPVTARLDENFKLIERHGIARFLPLYREIALIARQIAVKRKLTPPETPLEERPPRRGRGSPVAMLVGYPIGINHIDPLKWNLTPERFVSEDTETLPDIDLDFPPRDSRRTPSPRSQAIWNRASRNDRRNTAYRSRGAIAAVGGEIGLPKADLAQFANAASHIEPDYPAALRAEIAANHQWRRRLDAAPWRALMDLAPEPLGAPKALAQHVGGIALSGKPLSEMVPTRESAIDGRCVMDRDKNSAHDAGLAKIDRWLCPRRSRTACRNWRTARRLRLWVANMKRWASIRGSV